MTVSSSSNSERFQGNGTTKVFPLPFRFFENEDVTAYLLDNTSFAQTPLTLGVNYTLIGAGEPEEDGNPVSQLTMLVAPPTGQTLVVERIMDPVQETEIINQARFYPEIHENVFDRLTMLIQQAINRVGTALSLDPARRFFDARGFQIKNLGAPTAANDATTKTYVDTADSNLSSRIDSLSAGLPGTNYAFPWSTTTTQSTKTLTPGFEFASATLYLNGIAQTYGRSFSVAGNQIVLAEAIPAGTEVYAILGQNITPGDFIDAENVIWDGSPITESLEIFRHRNCHRKRVVKQLPIVFQDYVAIQTENGNSYLYPQGFYIDELAGEIMIAYNASGGTYTRHIVCYNLTTGSYLGCYQLALAAGSGGGESFTVVRSDENRRILVNKYDGNQVAFYDITTRPSNRAVVSPTSLKDCPMYFQISSKGGQFMAEDSGPVIGGSTSRTSHTVYNGNFERIRSFNYTKMDSGFQSLESNSLAKYIPKAQGVALGDGFVATVHGGIVVFSDSSTTGNQYAYQGPRIYSPDGHILMESICEPFKMKAIFEANGLPTDRFEYEGVCVTDSGKIMTLMLHQSRFGTQATKTGIVIFEEFSNSVDSIDFTSAVYTFAHQDMARLDGGIFPRSAAGQMYNPVSQSVFSSIEQIIDYMDLMDVKNFVYYNPSVAVTPISGMVLDQNSEVKITNCNHITFHATIISNNSEKVYEITGSSGSRTAKLLRYDSNGLRMATEDSGVVDRLHRMRGENRDPSKLDILFMDLQSNSANNDLRIGGGSGAFRSCTQLRLFTAPDVDSASVERFQINASGHFRPLADNTYSVGLSTARLTDVFSRQFRPGSGAPIWTSGSGTPEGSLVAPVGSVYTRTDGGAGTTLYVKESGTGSAGWVAK